MNDKAGHEVAYELRCAIVTCRNIFGCTYFEIEQKIGVVRGTAQTLMKRALKRAGCEDFHEVLAYVGVMERSGRVSRVADGTDLSAKIRTAILQNLDVRSQQAVLNKENITVRGMPRNKGPARSIIERVQYQHEHIVDGEIVGEIVRVVQSIKPLRINKNENHRKRLCKWASDRIDDGDIFIYSDEAWHEIGGWPSEKKSKISIVKGADPHELAALEPPVQFIIMRWGSVTSEGVIGPHYLWKAETKEEKDLNELKLKEANELSVKKLED